MLVKMIYIISTRKSVCEYIALHIEKGTKKEYEDRQLNIEVSDHIFIARKFLKHSQIGTFGTIYLSVSSDSKLASH